MSFASIFLLSLAYLTRYFCLEFRTAPCEATKLNKVILHRGFVPTEKVSNSLLNARNAVHRGSSFADRRYMILVQLLVQTSRNKWSCLDNGVMFCTIRNGQLYCALARSFCHGPIGNQKPFCKACLSPCRLPSSQLSSCVHRM